MRSLLLLAIPLVLLAAGCVGSEDESTPTGDEGIGPPGPASSAMCLEGAADCNDTVATDTSTMETSEDTV